MHDTSASVPVKGEVKGGTGPVPVFHLAFLVRAAPNIGGELSVGLLTDVFRRDLCPPAHTRRLPS